MAETLRMGQITLCPNCYKEVNPLVISAFLISDVILVQCPTCGRSWEVLRSALEPA